MFQLRRTLRLGTSDNDSGPSEFTEEFIAGALSRMGYTGSRRGRFFTKTCVFGRWRFLWHVMATVFAPRKSGYDELNPAFLSAMLSFVYNKPMAFTQLLFSSFVGQVTGSVKSRFLLYPRFTMLLINDLLPEFPEVQPTLFVNVLGVRAFNVCFMYKDKKSDVPRPVEQPLFGAVVDSAYEAPPENDWIEREPFVLFIGKATEAVNPEVARLEGRQELELEPSEDSSQGLKLLLKTALKGKRKVSEMEGEQSLLGTGRRTRSTSRRLLIENVSNEELNIEKDTSPVIEKMSNPSDTEMLETTDREGSPTMVELSPPPHSPSAASPATNIHTDDPRILKLESKVRKLRKANKKLALQLESVTKDTRFTKKLAFKLVAKVRELSSFGGRVAKRLQFVSNSVTEQNTAYSLLLQEKSIALDQSNKSKKQIRKLQRKVKNLQKNLSAQGGVKRAEEEEVKRAEVKDEKIAEEEEDVDMDDDDDVMLISELSSSSVGAIRRSSRRKNNK